MIGDTIISYNSYKKMLPFYQFVYFSNIILEEINSFASFPIFFGIPPSRMNALISKEGYIGQVNIIQ